MQVSNLSEPPRCPAAQGGGTIDVNHRHTEAAMPAPESPPVPDRRRAPRDPSSRTDRRRGAWTLLSGVEALLAATAVLLDLLLPALVLALMAAASLAVRREGPRSLGFRPLASPARRLLQVTTLTVGWTAAVFLLVMPVAEHLTGTTQDVSEFADLEGDLPRFLLVLGLAWTLAAVVEELAFRGYLLTRITDVVGSSPLARAAAVVAVALLFAVIHDEQGVVGMVLVFVDALFFGVLRYAFGSVWASVVAHGVSNTIGLTAFFLLGPFSALW